MSYVFKKGKARIRYEGEGYYSANSTGWFGPSDYTIYGAYTLVKDKFNTFQDWTEHVKDKLNNPDIPVEKQLDMTKQELTQTDKHWISGGNSVYYEITGKRGQHGFFDSLFEDIYYSYSDYAANKISEEFHDQVDLENVFDDYISEVIEHLNDDLSNIGQVINEYGNISAVSTWLYEHEATGILNEIKLEITEKFPEYAGSDLQTAIKHNPDMLTDAHKMNKLKDLENYQDNPYKPVPELDQFIQDKINNLRAVV